MSEHSVTHASFTIARLYPAPPDKVYAAWSDPAQKIAWFSGPDDGTKEHTMDFRIGGREFTRSAGPGGSEFVFEAVFYDIVENTRIVYAYDMLTGGRRISVSLATLDLKPEGGGTKLTYTEQGAFLDGLDKVEFRKKGVGFILDKLGAAVHPPAGNA